MATTAQLIVFHHSRVKAEPRACLFETQLPSYILTAHTLPNKMSLHDSLSTRVITQASGQLHSNRRNMKPRFCSLGVQCIKCLVDDISQLFHVTLNSFQMFHMLTNPTATLVISSRIRITHWSSVAVKFVDRAILGGE